MRMWSCAALSVSLLASGCHERATGPQRLRWYVFDEPSGAFDRAAARCSDSSHGKYRIDLVLLPADADQQREQLVRRLAAGDSDIDIIGMDVIWTAEFAEAGWILSWPERLRGEATRGRLERLVDTATYRGALWGVPFTTNTQLLWYRSDRVPTPPSTWGAMIRMAESLGDEGAIQAQGARYEGLTVFFTSLLASAGGSVLEADGHTVSLEEQPTRAALSVMKRLATSSAADPSLPTAREDQARLAFEEGDSSFMINYPFVWPSAKANAPDIAAHMRWARWPSVFEGRPSRVTIGGINLGIGSHTKRPELAYAAAICLASEANQRLAASLGGLPPTIEKLYDDHEVRETFPFADLLREALRNSVERPKTPLYVDVSLAISHTLHPMREIDPIEDVSRLREAVHRALRSEGLL
ncbi:MAG: ABC transporter substrate-binding protein [Myxococcales bacterium]